MSAKSISLAGNSMGMSFQGSKLQLTLRSWKCCAGDFGRLFPPVRSLPGDLGGGSDRGEYCVFLSVGAKLVKIRFCGGFFRSIQCRL